MSNTVKTILALIVLATLAVGITLAFTLSFSSTGGPEALDYDTDMGDGLAVYTNDTYSYSLEYPMEWKVSEYGGDVSIQPEGLGLEEQYIRVRKEDGPLESLRRSRSSRVGGNNAVETEITFAGQKAYAYTEDETERDEAGNIVHLGYEVLIPRGDIVLDVYTQQYQHEEIQHAFASLKFTK